MAFENLMPHKDRLLAWQSDGLGLTDIIDRLANEHHVETTPGTLSRFFKAIGSPQRNRPLTREPTAEEKAGLDAVAMLTEVLIEIRGRGDEQREVIEDMAGKIAGLSADVQEVEKRLDNVSTNVQPHTVPASIIRQIWLRAFLMSLVLCGGIFAAAWLALVHAS